GLDEVRLLRMHPRIDMLAPIAVRPAIEGALLHRGQIVGDKLGAEFVALVDYRPQHVRCRLESERGRVTNARDIDAPRFCRGIDLPDHRPIFLEAETAFADI